MSSVPTPIPAEGFGRFFSPLAGLFRTLPFRLRRHVSNSHYRSEIDGLRFFAIAIVVIGHFAERAVRFFPDALGEISQTPIARLFQHPGFGVYLFFSISGFIIAGQARKAKTSPLSGRFLKSYFGRRVLRIEPPYMILLFVTFLALQLTGYTPEGTNQFQTEPHSLGLSLAGSIFYLHGLLWGTFPRLFPPGWSLEAEVQFYVLAPLIFWTWFKLKTQNARIGFGIAVLLVGELISLNVPFQIGGAYTDHSLIRFFPFFWLGILLADLEGWIVQGIKAWPVAVLGALGWLGFATYMILPPVPDEQFALGLVVRLGVYLSIAAMFASAFAGKSSFYHFCTRPWVSLIGGACYSIYLTHLQLIQVMTGCFAKLVPKAGVLMVAGFGLVEVMVVVCGGLCFYAFLERPFMVPQWHRQLWARLTSQPFVPAQR